ncbi:MAG: hypothetical protein HY787_20920 [Deltaproteobacteria bacterium]|nr:hypothetical protein [Deltaproteobacteria bacterium]
MEKIELEIIPENPSKPYTVGEIISWKVRVTALEDRLPNGSLFGGSAKPSGECDGLDLVLGLKGMADVREGINKFELDHQEDLTKKTLYQGRWSADVYTYPFEIEVPAGPYT